MRRNLFTTAVLTGGAALLLAVTPVLAQAPGSMASPQSAGQPGRTTPANPTATQPGMPTDTMQTAPKVDDKKFLHDAALGGITEVELGKLAADKGSSDAVKQFGQKMVDDHSKANDELKKIASEKSVNVPDSLDSKHQSRVDKLSKLSGPAFDKAYIKDQLKDHQQDVRDFQNEAQNGNDAAVKDFAAKTLPTLQQHLAMAKDLNSGKSSESSADRSK